MKHELERKLCILEATVHGAVKELEQDRAHDRLAFGLHESMSELRELVEKLQCCRG